jgi:hypothetical protein
MDCVIHPDLSSLSSSNPNKHRGQKARRAEDRYLISQNGGKKKKKYQILIAKVKNI